MPGGGRLHHFHGVEILDVEHGEGRVLPPPQGECVSLGGPASRLGHPASDENDIGDGSVPRSNRCRPRSDAEATASIRWSKGNGASAIGGSMRGRWIARGAEKSTLGYRSPPSGKSPAVFAKPSRGDTPVPTP